MDKLKKQIKEAKELKRQEKRAKSGKADTTTVVNQLFDGTEVAVKKTKQQYLKNNNESDNEDDLLVVKVTGKEPTSASNKIQAMPEKDGKSEMLTTKTKKSTKVPKLKISLDGELKGAKGKKIVFKDSDDNEGEEEGMVDGEEDQKQRIERHAVRLRERIDKGRKEVTLFIMCLHMISVIATGTSNFSRNVKKYFFVFIVGINNVAGR